MKKLILSLALVLLLNPTTSFAHGESPRESARNTRQEAREERVENRKDARQEIKENIQERVQEIRSNIAEMHANRLERRFNFYYERLSGIASRITSRLAILKNEGKDVGEAETKLAEAKVKLESARSLGAQAVAAFRAIDPDKFAEQRSQALAARDLANQARVAFRETHQLLKASIMEVK